MKNTRRLIFDEIDHQIIEYFQDCEIKEPIAQTFMAYLGQIYPYMSVGEIKEYGLLVALQRCLPQIYPISALEVFLEALRDNGFLDNLNAEHIEAVICEYIKKHALHKEDTLKARLPEIMSMLRKKLEMYGEYRRQHYLHEPAEWAVSKESKDSFERALKAADVAIKLPASSGETFFESWKIGSVLIDKLREGVDVKILFVHPVLGSVLDGLPSAQKTVDMAKQFLKEVDQQLKGEKKEDLGKIEIRWIRQRKFSHFTGLLTYTSNDKPSPKAGVARLNIHRMGVERATVGLMLACDNEIGDTSLFRILEAYFDEAWRRAEPLSGIKLWLSRITAFLTSYLGIVLTISIIAALFLVNTVLANILFFIYPVILAILWRRRDETTVR